MAKASAKSKTELKPEVVPPKEYNAFVKGLELKRVRLVDGKVEAKVDHPAPASTEIRAQYKRSFENRDKGFEAFATYRLEFVNAKTNTLQGVIETTFGLLFDSHVPMRDDIFEIFGELNLKLNSWPFAREYVQTNLGRMDWPGFTLPLLKHISPSVPKQKKASGKANKVVES